MDCNDTDIGAGSSRAGVTDITVADERVHVLEGGLVVGVVRFGCLPAALVLTCIGVELTAARAAVHVESVTAW